MWRLLGFVFFGAVVCLIVCFLTHNASATSGSWLDNTIVKLHETPISSISEDGKTCGGYSGVINISGENIYTDACIFGVSSGVRLARYRMPYATFAYAVAFPSDGSFFPVEGLCTGLPQCTYAQFNDTLLLQVSIGAAKYRHVFIRDFTKYLKKVDAHYRFEHPEPYDYLRINESYSVVTRSVSMSSNGRWALIEIIGLGIIRLDLKTLGYKRIIPYDSLVAHSNQSFELTISNDGRWVVLTGYTAGIILYEINDLCGDVIQGLPSAPLANETINCSANLVNSKSLFVGFTSAHLPRFSSDGERLLLGIQTQDQFIEATLAPNAISSGPYYLAFGDSFSSGEGESSDNFYINSTNSPTNHCHVSSRSYPYLLGTSWGITTSNLACSGSRIEGVQKASKSFVSDTQTPRPSIVSLGVGGNDVDFMGKLKSCIGPGTCEWAKKDNKKATALEIKEQFSKIVDIINELKTTLAPAYVFLVGYPNVVNDQPDATCSVIVSALLDADERQYMSESIKYLNKVLRAAASYAKVRFIDIEDAYAGERLCDQKESAMNSVRYGDDIAPIPFLENLKLIGAESFHPTPRGHQLSMSAINTQVNPFSSQVCDTCQFNETQLEIGSYWLHEGASDKPPPRQLSKLFLNSESLVRTPNVLFNFLSNTFAPNSNVVFELRSEPQQLGDLTASNDGSLEGLLTLPDDVEGYHTVHAYGESRSGEKLDIYQTVYIDTKKASPESETKRQPYTSTLVRKLGGMFESNNKPTDTQFAVGGIGVSSQLNGNVAQKTTKVNDQIEKENTHSNPGLWWYVIFSSCTGLLFLGVWRLLSKRKK